MQDKFVIARAVHSLIGDNVKTIDLDNLYARTKDKSEQFGLYAMSFPHFVDVLRENKYKIDNFSKVVTLPKRIAL